MQKIITLFQRDYQGTHQVYDVVVPGAEWVSEGQGVPTRKWDGTCCMVRHGRLYKRYDAKSGRTPPADFEPAQAPDPVTGHWPGWLPVKDIAEDRWFRDAFARRDTWPDGTYELVGPKVQGNPERLDQHQLIPHGADVLPDVTDRSFDGLKTYLATHNIEGIVFHHPDGRMVKIKARDFGLRRSVT